MDSGVLQNIIIDGFSFPANFAKYKTRNTFKQDKTPSTLSNGEISVDNVFGYYRPTIDITFGICDIANYRTFIQKINRAKFNITYYDFELGLTVTRTMRAEKIDIDRLYGYLTNICGVKAVSVTFSCIYAYESYDTLNSGVHL